MDPYTIISHPLSTEKSIRLMESENTLLFAVGKRTIKSEIKTAAETLFKAKVTGVRTYITPKGKKRAYITFALDTPAIDVATQLGMM